MSELDASYVTTAQFNHRLLDSYPQLETLEDALQAVGQSVSPYVGEIENKMAILFEDEADRYVDKLESIFAGPTDLGFQRFSDPAIGTTGRVATVVEAHPAADALNI